MKAMDPDYRLRKGQEAVRAGDDAEAERFARLLEDDFQFDRARLVRGELLIRREQYTSALKILNQVADQGALRRQAALLQGECLFKLGNPRDAEQLFQFVLSEDPRQIEAHRYLGAIYYDQGVLSAAVKHLREVAALDPNDARPHRLIALINKDLDQMDEAIDAYEEARRRSRNGPLDRELRIELGECRMKKGENNSALALVDGLDDEPAEFVRASALLNLAKNDEARTALDDSLRRYADSNPLLRLRAQLHVTERQPQEAVRLLERAAQLNPADFRGRHQLAVALETLGKTEEAAKRRAEAQELLDLLRQATELNKEAMGNPWDANVRLRLATVFEKLGKPELAKMWRHAAAACRGQDVPRNEMR
jgi:tetratricopeptide (TPR) repeat protein